MNLCVHFFSSALPVALIGVIITHMIRDHYDTVKQNTGTSAALCIVSKHRTPEEILSYYEQGERIFAENRAEELISKAEVLPADIQWHFIGHLQRNKVRKILPYVSMIQSLDSIALADVIEKEAARIGKVIPVLAEFHLALEDTGKSGLDASEADALFAHCEKLEHVRIEGIMAMGPHTDNRNRIREVFTQGRELFDTLKKTYDIHILSMGMSDDYTEALACGSNMVRIGTYLFEK